MVSCLAQSGCIRPDCRRACKAGGNRRSSSRFEALFDCVDQCLRERVEGYPPAPQVGALRYQDGMPVRLSIDTGGIMWFEVDFEEHTELQGRAVQDASFVVEMPLAFETSVGRGDTAPREVLRMEWNQYFMGDYFGYQYETPLSFPESVTLELTGLTPGRYASGQADWAGLTYQQVYDLDPRWQFWGWRWSDARDCGESSFVNIDGNDGQHLWGTFEGRACTLFCRCITVSNGLFAAVVP